MNTLAWFHKGEEFTADDLPVLSQDEMLMNDFGNNFMPSVVQQGITLEMFFAVVPEESYSIDFFESVS